MTTIAQALADARALNLSPTDMRDLVRQAIATWMAGKTPAITINANGKMIIASLAQAQALEAHYAALINSEAGPSMAVGVFGC